MKDKSIEMEMSGRKSAFPAWDMVSWLRICLTFTSWKDKYGGWMTELSERNRSTMKKI